MEPNQKKTFAIIAIAVVAVVALVLIGARQGFLRNGAHVLNGNQETGAAKTPVTYSPDVPKNIELTKPTSEALTNPGSKTGGQTRLFNISISKSGFDPDQIVVNNGDLVKLTIQSIDGDYDLDLPSIGGYQFVKKGESRPIGFQALKTGTFTYICRDHCPSQGIILGKFIVK